MAPKTSVATAEVVLLSAERRIRSALRALLETGQAYTVSVAATPEEAHRLLEAVTPAAVVVGLGSSSGSADSALVRIAEQGRSRSVVVVGSRGGLDLDADPDTILAAVERAVGGSPTTTGN